MALSDEAGNTTMRLWLLLHRTNDLLSLCEDSIYREYGLTAEQWRVLARLKYYGRPLNPTELAWGLDRSSNSVSMLVDRMVKAGLVKRARDRKDRRVVWVSMTAKGENAIEPAIPEGWKLIQKVLTPLSPEDRRTLVDMLETVKGEAFACLHPEMDKPEIARRSSTNAPDIYTRMSRHLHRSGSSAQPDTGATEQQRLCPDGT
jgi:DNA-binding MarR family transcriptional regulator